LIVIDHIFYLALFIPILGVLMEVVKREDMNHPGRYIDMNKSEIANHLMGKFVNHTTILILGGFAVYLFIYLYIL